MQQEKCEALDQDLEQRTSATIHNGLGIAGSSRSLSFAGGHFRATEVDRIADSSPFARAMGRVGTDAIRSSAWVSFSRISDNMCDAQRITHRFHGGVWFHDTNCGSFGCLEYGGGALHQLKNQGRTVESGTVSHHFHCAGNGRARLLFN